MLGSAKVWLIDVHIIIFCKQSRHLPQKRLWLHLQYLKNQFIVGFGLFMEFLDIRKWIISPDCPLPRRNVHISYLSCINFNVMFFYNRYARFAQCCSPTNAASELTNAFTHTSPLIAVPSVVPWVVLQTFRSMSGRTVCTMHVKLGTSKWQYVKCRGY